MFRLLGHILPEKKSLGIALTSIYGIGQSRARKICEKINIDFDVKVKDLDETQEKIINDEVRTYILENDLRREVNGNIKSMKELKTSRGMKHNMGMPVRGQQTKTNAKTAKKLLGRSRVRPIAKK